MFPIVEIAPVSNVHQAWVALGLHINALEGDVNGALHQVFDQPDLLAAVAPLNCIVSLEVPSQVDSTLRAVMPPSRISFGFSAQSLASEQESQRLTELHDQGYRILLDGPPPAGVSVPAALRGVMRDCQVSSPAGQVLASLFGPHLAYGVDSVERLHQCEKAGFELFSGRFPFHPLPSAEPNDGSSRKRLLALLGLLASDGETREIEAVLKQDPALSYHLLKLANSAAFAHSMPITSFGQAISLLGRRQLQRWLQLLLYARQQPDGVPNALLPIAAQRAAQLEALVKLRSSSRDDQDLAFMTGVFSLLDHLLNMPMGEIVGALNLVPAASDALLSRSGPFGNLLALTEADTVSANMLDEAGLQPAQWFSTQLHAYHWAIQVSRNL